MKRTFPLVGLLLLGIGLTFGGLAMANRSDRHVSEMPVQSRTSQIDVKDVEQNLPLHPNAQAVETVVESQMERKISFRTTEPLEDVLAFYKDELPKQGWTITRDDSYPLYKWRDPQGVAAWGVHLSIRTERLLGDENLVELRSMRWPEDGKVPLYTGAEQVEVSETLSKDGLPLRVTEYIVNAPPQAVEDHYKSALQEQGWTFEVDESRPITEGPGLLFRALYGKGRNLSIVAQVTSDGRTHVEMQLLEYGTSLPHP